ncbi:hypothetical protein E3U43_015685 [Larimichthys crocea]|uniref:Uncharacterized protein n=1 Tax=Larimichthys crocea TaxID=215358 RepID=A0ACD3RPY8_LARCR|nr:hypothetical protein E3U43_015685 [Larimichthys crocea]
MDCCSPLDYFPPSSFQPLTPLTTPPPILTLHTRSPLVSVWHWYPPAITGTDKHKQKKVFRGAPKIFLPVVKRRAPRLTSPHPHSSSSPHVRPPGGAALTSQYYNNNSDKKRQPCTLLLNAVH